MPSPQRVLGYARVSSVEQAIGTSLQDQQDVIRAYAKSRGLKVGRMFVEAESGGRTRLEKREQVQALMADVREGDLVLVDKLDRWSRDPEFTYSSIRQILSAGASFYAVGDDCDPSTSQGDTVLGFRILFAREEHKRIVQRTVGTRKILRANGYYVEGLPPWGYRRQDTDGVQRNVLVIDDAQAEHVRMAFHMCVDGRSLSEIGAALGQPKDRVYKTLTNRIYLGEIEDGKKTPSWICGKHPALVDARLFAAAQDALERRRLGDRPARGGGLTATWWLRDRARCAKCSAKMSAAYGGSTEERRFYFKCYARCGVRYVPVRWAEEQCAPLVEARLVDLRSELASATKPTRAKTVDTVDERRSRLQKRRAKFLEAFADGMMSRYELREAMAKVDAERTKIDAIAQAATPMTTKQVAEVLRSVDAIRRAWRVASEANRRAIFNSLASDVFLAVAEAPRIAWFSGEDLARRALRGAKT